MLNRSGIVPLPYAGASLLFSWIYLLFYANSAGIEAAAPVSLYSAPYTISAMCMMATMAIIAFSPIAQTKWLTSIAAKILPPVGTSVGTLLLIVNGFDPADGFHSALLIGGGVLTGVFSGIMAQQWVIAYCRVGLKSAICSFPTLMAVAIGSSTLVMYLPTEIMYAVIIVLPLISGTMFHALRHVVEPHYDIYSHHQDKPMNFVLLLLPIIVFTFASGFLDFYSKHSFYTFVFYGLVAFIPLVIAGTFIIMVNREHVVSSLIVPVCFFVVIFVPFFTSINLTFAAQFISIGELGAEVVLFIVAICFADFFCLSPLKSYALTRAAITLINGIGWYFGSFSSTALTSLVYQQAALTLVLTTIEILSVVLIVAIVKAQKIESVEASQPETKPQGSTKADTTKQAQSIEAADASSAMGSKDASSHADEKPREGIAEDPLDTSLNKDQDARQRETETIMNDNRDRQIDPFRAKCLSVGNRYGLSEREIDVLALLARGYSSARIQAELYIAAGTVNYHTRNIYAKLGVHSKQEVIDLVAGDLA